jgi:DNA-binding MarR family transcriptional regulator
MNDTNPDLRKDILESLALLAKAFQDHAREIHNRMGLTPLELRMLQHLQSAPTSTPAVLSRQSGLDSESVDAVVKGLAGKGLVLRRDSGKTGRMLEAWLSAEGKLKLRQCPDSLHVRLDSALQSADPALKRSMASGLKGLLKQAGIGGPERPRLQGGDGS